MAASMAGRTRLQAEDLAEMVRPRAPERRPARLSEIVAYLAAYSAEDMGAAGVVEISGAGRREAQLVRLLRARYPSLHIRLNSSGRASVPESGSLGGDPMSAMSAADTPRECHEGLAQMWPAARHSPEMAMVCEAAQSLVDCGGVRTEGIFRLMRSLARVDALSSEMLAPGACPGRVNWAAEDAHDVAGAIKAYVRVRMAGVFASAEDVRAVAGGNVRAFVDTLSVERRAHVSFLQCLARAVDEESASSRMDASNMARVLAPNLFRHADPAVELALIATTIEATRVLVTSDL